jgi:hypothetical protein
LVGLRVELSSARYAVAVDATIPIEIPLMNRATSRPARLFEARKTIALTTEIPTAGSSSRRRPYKSDRCPARRSATITPTAYTANATSDHEQREVITGAVQAIQRTGRGPQRHHRQKRERHHPESTSVAPATHRKARFGTIH